MANGLVDHFDGEVPHRLRDLVTLPGVGRKTANVVRSVALDEPGLPVDTHVTRLSHRLGLTDETDAVKIELVLNAMIPAAERGTFSLRLILHGRRVCLGPQAPLRAVRAQRLLPLLDRLRRPRARRGVRRGSGTAPSAGPTTRSVDWRWIRPKICLPEGRFRRKIGRVVECGPRFGLRCTYQVPATWYLATHLGSAAQCRPADAPSGASALLAPRSGSLADRADAPDLSPVDHKRVGQRISSRARDNRRAAWRRERSASKRCCAARLVAAAAARFGLVGDPIDEVGERRRHRRQLRGGGRGGLRFHGPCLPGRSRPATRAERSTPPTTLVAVLSRLDLRGVPEAELADRVPRPGPARRGPGRRRRRHRGGCAPRRRRRPASLHRAVRRRRARRAAGARPTRCSGRSTGLDPATCASALDAARDAIDGFHRTQLRADDTYESGGASRSGRCTSPSTGPGSMCPAGGAPTRRRSS